jgi:hypothetical protein
LRRLRGKKPKRWRGYRNCDVCSRWRPVSDYPVYKSRSGYEQIKGQCFACKRAKERARYDRLDAKAKRAKGIKANQQAKKRRTAALHEIERLHKNLDKQNERIEKQWAKMEKSRTRILHWENGEAYLDAIPFRMWLLRQHRIRGYEVAALASEIGQDESRVRRWLDGFQWNGAGRDPTPIRSIKLTTVDEIAVALEDPGLLERLYPVLDPD